MFAACSDDASDTPYVFTGEYVDWDSTEVDFHGVAEATATVVGEPDNTATTAPNGRATLMLNGTQVVTFTAAGYLPMRFTAAAAAFPDGAVFSTLGLTPARRDSFFAEVAANLTPQPGTAQVLVEITGET